MLFHEYFCGDSSRGIGASHQTGWTALAVRFLEDVALRRDRASRKPGKAASTKASGRSRRGEAEITAGPTGH